MCNAMLQYWGFKFIVRIGLVKTIKIIHSVWSYITYLELHEEISIWMLH